MGRGLDRGQGLSDTATVTAPPAHGGRRPRVRRWLTLGGLLSGPLLWLGAAYLGSLAVLLTRSIFQRDELSNKLITSPTIDHLKTVATGEVYRATTVPISDDPGPPTSDGAM